MLNIKCDIKLEDLKIANLYFVKSEIFHSLGVVDRVSKTQVGENFNLKTLRFKG